MLIYLLIVINFQSWGDPFVIITALPAALAGIVWMLFATHTTLSVPALTGAIMCMGVATANSVLVISFAREKLDELGDATQAALEAGFVRLRPVLMTALAMVIGMLPMALGLGDGGEQNAPLGRAVIGGLIFATVSTLFFVPGDVQHHSSATMAASRAAHPPGVSRCPNLIEMPTVPARGGCCGRAWCSCCSPSASLPMAWSSRGSAKFPPAGADRGAGVADRGACDAEPRGEPRGLDLPGRLQAYIRAPIYARVPGYLQSWKHDIGSKVKAGDVLAVIETPDLDQQLSRRVPT